jgi:hypothetical protein
VAGKDADDNGPRPPLALLDENQGGERQTRKARPSRPKHEELSEESTLEASRRCSDANDPDYAPDCIPEGSDGEDDGAPGRTRRSGLLQQRHPALAASEVLTCLQSGSLKQLMALPGIGKKRATAILEFRIARPIAEVSCQLAGPPLKGKRVDQGQPAACVLAYQSCGGVRLVANGRFPI